MRTAIWPFAVQNHPRDAALLREASVGEKAINMDMDTKTFDAFRRLIYDKSGISLGPAKVALVSARIGKRLRALNLPDPKSYLRLLKEDGHEEEFVHFIDAISTNVTSFFRESDHFDFLAEALGRWVREGQRDFRFWSAACSSGEEPFSMAMTIQETLAGTGARAKILATDISTRVLQRCREGIYPESKIDSVPQPLRSRYFMRLSVNGSEKQYQVTDEVKKLIAFRRINLSVTPFPMKGPMDIIFIRNVMIYFDNYVREKLLAEAHRLLKPGGYLMVGHSEGLTGLVSNFKLQRTSVYGK